MATYLDRILAEHRSRYASDGRAIAEVKGRALGMAPTRPFTAALTERRGVSVIAEVKRRSPSRGDLAPGLDPAELARAYAGGGASCLSVLTDSRWFGGGPADLLAAREAVALPVLRKDFTVGPADVYDARIMGADAVLLIAAALSAAELADLIGVAGDVGIEALVEVHDEAEAAAAVSAGASLVGVNQRDLATFEVDTARAERVVGSLPAGVVRVAESGVRDGADAARLSEAGFDAVLVGESLVTSPDPAEAVRGLLAGASSGAGRR